MSTEPKDIAHETEPLRPILEAPWFEMVPADEVTRRLSNEVYVTQLEIAVGEAPRSFWRRAGATNVPLTALEPSMDDRRPSAPLRP